MLPGLIEASQTLLARHAPAYASRTTLPDVIVPASFNFPHTGKLLSLSFILFAGWFADAVDPLATTRSSRVTGLLTFFGSLNAAVPFLLDLFRIPADTFQLFLATGVINSRVGSLVAAVHTVTVALLGTCAIIGVLRFGADRCCSIWPSRRFSRSSSSAGPAWCSPALCGQIPRDQVLAGMHLLQQPAPATVLKAPTGVDDGRFAGPFWRAFARAACCASAT